MRAPASYSGLSPLARRTRQPLPRPGVAVEAELASKGIRTTAIMTTLLARDRAVPGL